MILLVALTLAGLTAFALMLIDWVKEDPDGIVAAGFIGAVCLFLCGLFYSPTFFATETEPPNISVNIFFLVLAAFMGIRATVALKHDC